jgi:lipid-A-disaccharide synthase-like uncharacterized protein
VDRIETKGHELAMNVSAETLDLIGRAGIDILAMLLLVGWLYRPSQSMPTMPLVLSSMNAGLFGAVTVFFQAASAFSAGLGFGLFALLSMIRLRSMAFTVKDVAFIFLALILGVINGLPGTNWALLGAVNIGLIAVVALTDSGREFRTTRVMRLTLEQAYSDPTEVRSLLEERLGLQITQIVIQEIDFVRETTELKISYVIDERWGKSEAEEMYDQADRFNWT